MPPRCVPSRRKGRGWKGSGSITIKEIRTDILKKTLDDMAQMLGITRNAYWMKETGRREFKCKELIAICKEANVHPFSVEL